MYNPGFDRKYNQQRTICLYSANRVDIQVWYLSTVGFKVIPGANTKHDTENE